MTTEARFRITDPGTFWSLQTIDQLGNFKFSDMQILEIHDDYLDTKKRRLLRAGYCCRRRKQDKGFLITFSELGLKKNKESEKQQWEVKLNKNTVGPVEWPKSTAKTRISKIIPNKKLQVMFTFIQTRITRQIRTAKQPFALAQLDDVLVINNGEEQNFKILALILEDPDQIENLNSLVHTLEQKWSLKNEPMSKFERALKMESA
jgi:inorganic triphosphatase YgiF